MELLTIKELSEILKMHVGTLYNLRKDCLPCKIAKPLRFDLEVVIEWLNSRGGEK